MIATITLNSHRMLPSHEAHRFPLNSNSAGGPLPIIPRRMSASPSTLSTSRSLPTSLHSVATGAASTSAVTLALTSTSISTGFLAEASSSRHDSDSSSFSSGPSDGSRPTIRPKRIRGVRRVSPIRPPAPSASSPSTIVAPPSSAPPSSSVFARVSTITTSKAEDGSNKDHAQRPASCPSPRPLLYTPGMSLRLCKDSLKAARNASESHVSLAIDNGPKFAPCEILSTPTSFDETKVIRKKSGQLVKPSLKTSRSASRNNLSILTASTSTKSEPTTPTSKAVHFDTKLEHVKLFLAEQKPLAVSRDGSPTDDTSGTDSDFPKFIYGDGPNDSRITFPHAPPHHQLPSSPARRLVMQVANMPPAANPNSDVALEDLSLTVDGTNIVGRVRVRNIAYSKWVAVRFTFDSWQTTSEVVGRYVESLGPHFDRFAFTIRLSDLLARIELKTLILAVRYSIEGKEMWDNNNGQNYYATFTKAKVAPAVEERSRKAVARSISDDEGSDLADLQSKLEKVIESRNRTGPAFFNSSTRRHSSSSSVDSEITSFKSTTSFASRYDLSTSLKSPWRPVANAGPSASPPFHHRTRSFPLGTSTSKGNVVPWPTKGPSELHIPKRKTNNTSNTVPPRSPSEFENALASVSSPTLSARPQTNGRNHQRGYFDIPMDPPTLRRTPPGSPFFAASPIDMYEDGRKNVSSPPARCNSFPPVGVDLPSGLDSGVGLGFGTRHHGRGGSVVVDGSVTSTMLSTPSMSVDQTPSSPSSSRNSTPSPLETSPFSNPSGLPVESDYHQFIDKFCFFTGSQGTMGPSSSSGMLHHPHEHRSISNSTGGSSGSSILPVSSSSSSSSSRFSATSNSSTTITACSSTEPTASSPPLSSSSSLDQPSPSSPAYSSSPITTASDLDDNNDDKLDDNEGDLRMISRSGSSTPTVSQTSIWRTSTSSVGSAATITVQVVAATPVLS